MEDTEMEFRKISYSGFSLLELLITLAIVSIVIGTTVPNFSAFIEKNRIDLAANTFFNHPQLARMHGSRMPGSRMPGSGLYFILR